jgi:parvulin-like peptidyl-prolyl isomerase
LDALFSQAELGVVPRPVRTEYGYHAIVVTEITPAVITGKPEAFATLHAELTTAKRKARLDALLRELQQHTPVRYAADAEGRLAQVGL